MKTIFLILLAIFALDYAAFYLFPLEGISLDPSHECNVPGVEQMWLAGCAPKGEGIGFVKYPSFLVAVHEFAHAQGADEPLAASISVIMLIGVSISAYFGAGRLGS